MIKIEIEYEAMHFEKYKNDDTYIDHKTRLFKNYSTSARWIWVGYNLSRMNNYFIRFH